MAIFFVECVVSLGVDAVAMVTVAGVVVTVMLAEDETFSVALARLVNACCCFWTAV